MQLLLDVQDGSHNGKLDANLLISIGAAFSPPVPGICTPHPISVGAKNGFPTHHR